MPIFKRIQIRIRRLSEIPHLSFELAYLKIRNWNKTPIQGTIWVVMMANI